jgi:competence protein ComGC
MARAKQSAMAYSQELAAASIILEDTMKAYTLIELMIVGTLVLIIGSVLVVSCAPQNMRLGFKHFESNITGLNRHIVYYSMDGKVLREWTGTCKIEYDQNSGDPSFLINGKMIKLHGSYLIEEL